MRKLILAGTGPKGAPGMEGWAPDVIEGVVIDDSTPEGYIHVFYTGSPESLSAGQVSADRIFARQEDRGAWPSTETKNAQYRAVETWGIQDWSAVQRAQQERAGAGRPTPADMGVLEAIGVSALAGRQQSM